jgi:chorismate mutase
MLRGVRGAVQAEANKREAILAAAEELMKAVIRANEIEAHAVASVFFTVTSDLDAAFPAAVRETLEWSNVPFLCGCEIPVPGSLPRVIRVLILYETEKKQEAIRHQYLGEAKRLRPDL